MPWHVGAHGSNGCSGFPVIKDADGSVAGCHPTKAAAQRQVAALYANEANMGKNAALGDNVRAQLTAAQMNDAPDSDFAYIEPGGKKDAQGKTVPRSLRHFYIGDAAHVRNALAQLAKSPFGAKARPKVEAAAREFGIGEPAAQARSEVTMSHELLRVFPVEGIRILTRAQGAEYADGRTVEAYAAVFDTPTEIHDAQGVYMETIDRGAFNRVLDHARPQGQRAHWNVKVLYNHGMTVHGTPSDRASGTIGRAEDIRVDGRGLLTITRYNETPFASDVLEMIRNGDITAQSFRGRIVRSEPNPGRHGGYDRRRNGDLQTVRRLELGLIEYGPSPFAAYPDAAVLSVRTMSAWPTSTTPEGDPDEADTPPDGGPVPDDPSDPAAVRHSSRVLHHAIAVQRIKAARTTRPELFGSERQPS